MFIVLLSQLLTLLILLKLKTFKEQDLQGYFLYIKFYYTLLQVYNKIYRFFTDGKLVVNVHP
jgi:hypothetical protein